MKYLKRFNEELHFNENVDYKYIVDLILNTDGNSSWDLINNIDEYLKKGKF